MIVSALSSYIIDNEQSLGEVINYYPFISFYDEEGSKQFDIMNKYFLMFQGNVPKDRTEKDIT